MAGRNRWSTQNPDYDSGQVDPGPDNCCCSWLKPKSKTEDTNREGKGKEYSNGGNKNEWFVPDSSSPGVSRDQQGTLKTNNYMEIDPIDTAMNGALKEKQVWTQDQENSHGISGNKKPSSQQEDYRPQEIKKNGKYMTPNAANVSKSKDQGYSEEENNASHGGTRPKKTISSTVEQASTLVSEVFDKLLRYFVSTCPATCMQYKYRLTRKLSQHGQEIRNLRFDRITPASFSK